MKSHWGVLIFVVTVLFGAPALFEAGELLQGHTLGFLLPTAAVGAAFLYARWGEGRPAAPQAPDGDEQH